MELGVIWKIKQGKLNNHPGKFNRLNFPHLCAGTERKLIPLGRVENIMQGLQIKCACVLVGLAVGGSSSTGKTAESKMLCMHQGPRPSRAVL